MSAQPDKRPEGRDEVYAAILEAAGTHFARHGMRASLREIAADANVNLGLIHRHIGNKDDLLRAVLNSRGRVGADVVEKAPDIGTAVARLFEVTATSGVSARTMAWLLLGSDERARFPEALSDVRALRAKIAADGGDDVALMAATALIGGWAVFGDQLLEVFDCPPDERSEIVTKIAGLTADLVTGRQHR